MTFKYDWTFDGIYVICVISPSPAPFMLSYFYDPSIHRKIKSPGPKFVKHLR